MTNMFDRNMFKNRYARL